MDKKLFDVITAPNSKRQGVQCKRCGAASGVLRVGEELDTWCENHKCGEEAKPVEAAPPADPAPEPDTEDEEEDEKD